MVGLLIFTLSISAYFYYGVGVGNEDTTDFSELLTDVKRMGSSLISAGEPEAWTNESVIRIGLTDGDSRIDTDKLTEFSDMNYTYRRQKLGTTKNYEFYLAYVNGTRFNYLGKNSTNATDLVQTTRLAIYNNEIILVRAFIWQE